MRGKRLENGADVDKVREPLLSARIPDTVRPPPSRPNRHPPPRPRSLKENPHLGAFGIFSLFLNASLIPTSLDPSAHVLFSGVFLA